MANQYCIMTTNVIILFDSCSYRSVLYGEALWNSEQSLLQESSPWNLEIKHQIVRAESMEYDVIQQNLSTDTKLTK